MEREQREEHLGVSGFWCFGRLQFAFDNGQTAAGSVVSGLGTAARLVLCYDAKDYT